MKKISFLLVALLMLFVPFIAKADEKAKVNLYLFRGEGCPHCEEAIEWFENTFANDEEFSGKYELVKYEVWYDEDNANLMDKVAKALGTEANGVPFIVIGSEYFSGFSATESPDLIKNAINKAYDDENYTDIVKNVIDNKVTEEKNDNNQLLPIIIVSAVAIVTVIALVFFTKERE